MFLARSAKAESMLSLSAEARTFHIQHELGFIAYPEASAALGRMRELFDYPPTHRPPCLLLTGEAANGKTRILRQFAAAHPPDRNLTGEADQWPVLSFNTPFDCTPKALFLNILRKLDGYYNPRGATAVHQEAALHAMKQSGVRLLMIDDITNLEAMKAYSAKHREMLNLLRALTSELEVPLVLAGLTNAERVLRADRQLSSRFELIALPPWTAGDRLAGALSLIERNLPLRRRSDLTKPRIVQYVAQHAGGTLGGVLALIREAALLAVGDKEEITLRGLQRAPRRQMVSTAGG